MKKAAISLLLFLLGLYTFTEEIVKLHDGREIVVLDDHTWAESPKGESTSIFVDKYKSQLRKGISASDKDIQTACEMLSQGWIFTMPRPKSG